MTNPLDKATSSAPPTVGEGCLSRYDLEALTPEDGAEFEGAAELWQQLQQTPPADKKED
ncbi:MAG: rane protein [Pseudomonas sp.]|nr:rane protein [Pseudomonas sp.]